MSDEPKSFRRQFLSSVQHALLGFSTLGLGLMASAPGRPWPILAGLAAYALGWIYLPDMPFFRRHVQRKHDKLRDAGEQVEIEAFRARHALLVQRLSSVRLERYSALLAVCRDIESAGHDAKAHGGAPIDPNDDLRLKKLEELAWTYLRLLSIEESLERFLETERRENLPVELESAQTELRALGGEVAELRKSGPAARHDSKQRLLESCKERLEVLHKRLERIEQAHENLKLVASEQSRLVQQVKLIRADAVASKNAAALSNRIDATVEQLNETNKWLAGLEEFKDLVGGLPETEKRIGFGGLPQVPARAGVPPLPGNAVTQRTTQPTRPGASERGGNS